MNFPENLKSYRQMIGMTQKQMAITLGITERGYRNYENGRNQPNLEDLVKIADMFRVSLDDLVGRDFPQDSLVDSDDVFKSVPNVKIPVALPSFDHPVIPDTNL